MIIQLRRILLHDLLRLIHRIHTLQRRHLTLLLGVLVLEEILNFTLPRRSLVDLEAGSKFPVRADLDRVEHVHGEVLAVVADDVVGGPCGAHVVDYHFAWDRYVRGGWGDGGMGLTSLPEGLVVEACLPNFEGVPFLLVDLLVDVDYIEVFVLCRLSALNNPTKLNKKHTIQSSCTYSPTSTAQC
jgi:hypothetical protein